MKHAVIVGGGIAGLATAWHLEKQAKARGQAWRYTLLEASPRLGGKIVTERVDDLIIEGGPDSFVTQKPAGTQLCRDLGLGDQLTGLNHRPVYVLYRGKLRAMPPGFYLAVPGNLVAFARSPLFSLTGKLRMAMEPFIAAPAERHDESLADFIRRRVGQEVLDRIAGPLMAGIFVADPEKLSMEGAFPHFLDMEQKHGSLIKAVREMRRQRLARAAAAGTKPGAPPPSPFLTLRGGLAQLVDALEKQLGGDLRPGVRVTRLSPLGQAGGFDVEVSQGEPLRADAVVLALPAFNTAELVEPFLPRLSELLGTIRYISTATVSLAFRREQLQDAHHLDGLGFIVANKEDHQVMACTINSNKFPHRAPEEKLLLRFFVGGYAQEEIAELNDAEMLQAVRGELRDILGIRGEPDVVRIYRWPRGNPQYDVGHLERVARMEALAAEVPGLHLTGSAYRGIGIPGCVANAERTVLELFGENVAD